MKKEKRIKIDKLVGRTEDGEYYWLDEVFEHAKNFRGACGSVFRPVTVAQKEEAMTPENAKERFRDLWQEAVRTGHTEDSLDEYVESIVGCDELESFFDLSYYDNGCEIAEIYNSELPADAPEEDNAEFCECVGRGRCFNHKIKWAKVYDTKALKLALSYEKD